MKFKNALSILLFISLTLGQFFSNSVFAEEIVISGNGDGSTNEVSIQNQSNTQVTQNNNAQIENKVSSEADTGNNEANDNSGDVKIETGDAETEVIVENSGNNSSAEIGCCKSDPASVTVSGNGENSNNQVNSATNNTNTVVNNNNLTIKNNISINSNTGNNEANNNQGKTTIKTGEIKVTGAIINSNLNSSKITTGISDPGLVISVSGNGANSNNSVSVSNNTNNNYFVNNNLNLINNIINFANTGNNKANSNSGNVKISTGDIYLDLILLNKDINSSVIEEVCCESPKPSESPSPTPTPTPTESPSPSDNPGGGQGGGCCSPTTDIPGPGGGGGSGGVSGGDVLGVTLPATGNFSFWTFTFLALLMFVLGVILLLDEKSEAKESYWRIFNKLKPYLVGAYIFANTQVLFAEQAANVIYKRSFSTNFRY